MIFVETNLQGAYVIKLERLEDERGFFARAWCEDEFAEHGLTPCIVQANISFNQTRGTLRGMHFQLTPFEEARLVRCTTGAIIDVIIDIRPDSKTYLRTASFELNADSYDALFVPEGFAHGFQTLEDNTEVLYHVSQFYEPGAARGIRFDDPRFAIEWPLAVEAISERDKSWPDYVARAAQRR